MKTPLTDTDRLNAIEIYDWLVRPSIYKDAWMVDGCRKGTPRGKTLRDAIDNAILAQTGTDNE